jgi:hypothetical protein
LGFFGESSSPNKPVFLGGYAIFCGGGTGLLGCFLIGTVNPSS